MFLLSTPSRYETMSYWSPPSPPSWMVISPPALSSDAKLKTRNPLLALNSRSKRNLFPSSALMWNVTSRSVTFESKSTRAIPICRSSPRMIPVGGRPVVSGGGGADDDISKVTCRPFSSTGGNVSLDVPCPATGCMPDAAIAAAHTAARIRTTARDPYDDGCGCCCDCGCRCRGWA